MKLGPVSSRECKISVLTSTFVLNILTQSLCVCLEIHQWRLLTCDNLLLLVD